jgi:hypothetical protein
VAASKCPPSTYRNCILHAVGQVTIDRESRGEEPDPAFAANLLSILQLMRRVVGLPTALAHWVARSMRIAIGPGRSKIEMSPVTLADTCRL